MTDVELPIAGPAGTADRREPRGDVRARRAQHGLTRTVRASVKSLRRGEVSQYTELLEDARRHAVDRLVANAKLLGAGGIVAMRFDSSEMGNGLTEVVAYGTAVVVERAEP